MRNFKICSAAALLLAASMLGGCATSRSELKLAVPNASPHVAVYKQRAVVIRTVRDDRQFADKPADPSTPSLGSGGASRADEAVKSRAFARKRNGFGQALGDVLLKDGQTVSGVMADNIAAAFREAGYRVAPDVSSAGPRPLLVDVRVTKFWAWVTPGMMTMKLDANVETDVLISDGGAPTLVSVSMRDDRMAVTESAWVEVVQKALAAYRTEAAKKFSAAPF